MSKSILYTLLLCYIICMEIQAGLIDSLAEVNTQNKTLAEGLPKKKNSTSKYDSLLNQKQKPLETALDAHNPVNHTLKDATEQKVDVNKLSENSLESLCDQAVAHQVTGKSTSSNQQGNKSSTDQQEEQDNSDGAKKQKSANRQNEDIASDEKKEEEREGETSTEETEEETSTGKKESSIEQICEIDKTK